MLEAIRNSKINNSTSIIKDLAGRFVVLSYASSCRLFAIVSASSHTRRKLPDHIF